MKSISQSHVNAIEEATNKELDLIASFAYDSQLRVAESMDSAQLKVEVILRIQKQINQLRNEMIRCQRAIQYDI
jgi:hypothetical protein